MTTNDSITAAQIEQLRTEAAEAGDAEQVRLCDLALTTWTRRSRPAAAALAKCVRAINYAESMGGPGDARRSHGGGVWAVRAVKANLS